MYRVTRKCWIHPGS